MESDQQLQKMQGNALAVLDAVTDAIVTIDAQGLLLYANVATQQMFEFAVADMLGRPVVQLISVQPGLAADNDQLVAELKANLGVPQELNGRKSSGETFPLRLTLSRLNHGSAESYACVMLDLTQLQLREESLHAQREQLARAGRMSTLGEMTDSIAHELNQPLAAIAMYAQVCQRLLNSNQPELTKLQDVLNKLCDQAFRAGEINERVQQFVRNEKGPRELQDLNQLMLDIQPLAASDARAHGIDLVFDLAEALPSVMCAAMNVQQVTLNLLRNAFDAMADIECRHGSTVILTTEHIESGTGDRVCVSVIDEGPGVAADVALNLFDAFHTSKKRGMGLGLSTCRTLIDAENGLIDYTNRTPFGCIFYFSLPVGAKEG